MRTSAQVIQPQSHVLLLAALACLFSACGGSNDRSSSHGPGKNADACSFNENKDATLNFAFADALSESVIDATAALSQNLPTALRPALVLQGASEGAEHFDFEYRAHGIPLCQTPTQVHRVGDHWLFNDELARGALVDRKWDADDYVFDAPLSVVERAANESRLTYTPDAIISQRPCLLVEDGGPVAAWELTARLKDKPYRIVGHAAKITSLSPMWFDAVGEAQVFKDNPLGGELISVRLPDLAEGTRLRSARFSTELESGISLAESNDHRFIYEPSDARFTEVSVFANAERMASWFLKPEHQYSMNCVPIVIRPHHRFVNSFNSDVDVNNGRYQPPEFTESGYPEIQLGDGDGHGLQNLGLDFDAVAHELGHHVLYRRLKGFTGESVVLHEGVSDYFVFAATGNACLGESVCPMGSGICALEGQCLRSAENSLRLDDPRLTFEPHKRSQFISGFLWDLGKTAEGGQDWVATTTMKAVDYLSAKSGYADFVRGMMAADLELEGGIRACDIYQAALNRGMGAVLASTACDTYVRR